MAATTAIKAILGGLRGRRLGHDVAGQALQRARDVEHFIEVACLQFTHRNEARIRFSAVEWFVEVGRASGR